MSSISLARIVLTPLTTSSSLLMLLLGGDTTAGRISDLMNSLRTKRLMVLMEDEIHQIILWLPGTSQQVWQINHSIHLIPSPSPSLPPGAKTLDAHSDGAALPEIFNVDNLTFSSINTKLGIFQQMNTKASSHPANDTLTLLQVVLCSSFEYKTCFFHYQYHQNNMTGLTSWCQIRENNLLGILPSVIDTHPMDSGLAHRNGRTGVIEGGDVPETIIKLSSLNNSSRTESVEGMMKQQRK